MKKRTSVQIREHYEIEKQIATRLRESTFEERKTLYTSAYDELFVSVPHHPLLTIKASQNEKEVKVRKEILNLKPFLNEQNIYLEIGPGDCSLSFEVAKKVKKVYAIDISKEITRNLKVPDNFELIISDGCNISVPPNSIDIAYSNQLMEHLHPDDSLGQLKNIYLALKKGGTYLCVTPNRLSGPHDISRHFDSVATGLHLKEYTITELDELFREIGFCYTKIYLRIGKTTFLLPIFPYKVCEKFISLLPHFLRKLITFNRLTRFLLGIKLLAKK